MDLPALGIVGLGHGTTIPVGNGVELDLTTHGGGTILLKDFIEKDDAADFLL